jgi:hypothetical protein
MRFLFFISLFYSTTLLAVASSHPKQSNWQQQVNHTIDATLHFDEKNQAFIIGKQTIVYHNHSKDELLSLHFHLWPNAYQNTKTPFAIEYATKTKKSDFHQATSKRGFVTIDSVDSRTHGIKTLLGAETEFLEIQLQRGLKPKDSLVLYMEFKVKLPSIYSRMGQKDDFIAATQWYPKPAVYDINGWNLLHYLNQGEFYSEFGNYNVTLTTSDSFLVAATGVLVKLDTTTHTRSYQFNQDNVHDFAWFASRHFTYIEDTLVLENGHKIVCSVFAYKQKPLQKTLDALKDAIRFYSKNVGDYPYATCTVVIGDLKAGGGMEYPTITICDKADARVVGHEVGHNWFYGILGSNERKYPWMDESLNTFYEMKWMSEGINPIESLTVGLINGSSSLPYFSYFPDKFIDLNVRRLGESQPANLTADAYKSISYYSVIYGRAAHFFSYLEAYMGKEKFGAAMKAYYEKWKYKHPLPGDFIEVMELFAAESLDWFFIDLFSDVKGTDFQILSLKQVENNQLELHLRNTSNLLIPIPYALFDSKRTESLDIQFLPPFQGDTVFFIKHLGALDTWEFIIDPLHLLPENKRHQNRVVIRKSTRPQTPFKLRFFPSPENPYYHEMVLFPALNYTFYSGLGKGFSLYNRVFPLKNLAYEANIYYSTRNNSFIGNAQIDLNYRYYDRKLYRIHAGMNFQRYEYRPNNRFNTYNKINPFAIFYFRTKEEHKQHFLKLDAIGIFSDFQRYSIINNQTGVETILPFEAHTQGTYLKAAYNSLNKHAVVPQTFHFHVLLGQGNLHTSNPTHFSKMELRYKVDRIMKGYSRKYRFEWSMGTFLHSSANLSGVYLFRGSENRGEFDYLYEETLLARNRKLDQGTWGQQLITAGGDMRMNATSFISRDFMAAKFTVPLPLLPVVHFYTDFAHNPLSSQNNSIFWASGFAAILIPDILEIYLPVWYSQPFRDFYELNNYTFRSRFAFKLDLNYFYPRKNVELYRNLLGF